MKRYILIVCLLFQVIVVCGQTIIYPDRGDSSILRIRDFYKGYGKVFYDFGQAVENIKGAEREMIISPRSCEVRIQKNNNTLPNRKINNIWQKIIKV